MSNIQRGILVANSPVNSVHRVIDAVAIMVVSYLAARLTPIGGEAGHSLVNEWLGVTAGAIVAFHAIGEMTGVYRSWRGARLRGELGCLIMNWMYTVAVLLGIGLITAYNARFTYESKIAWVFLTPLTMASLRILLRLMQRKLHADGWSKKRVAICGANELGVQLAQNLADAPHLGLDCVGFFEDRVGDRRKRMRRSGKSKSNSQTEQRTESKTDRRSEAKSKSERMVGVPEHLGSVIGNVDELVRRARSGEVDTIYLTYPMRAEERLRAVLNRLSDTTADVYIVPDFFVFELLHARLTNVGGLPAVSIHENPLYGIDGALKRAFDLSVGLLLLMLLALPMSLVALMVKLTSRGPVFFRQKRYGLDGREIMVWKFRSMRTEQCSTGEAGTKVKQATKDDPRITPIGGLLRRSSLDELPQLFNVLGGSMSLVGPRPHASAHNEEYRTQIDGYMLRHKVKPGITGLAQVMGFRGETDTLDKMEGRIHYDHEYIRTWSLMMDVEILFRTVWVVLGQKNAY